MCSTQADASRSDRALLTLTEAVWATGYRFITITPLTHARVNARPENAWAEDLAGVFGWSRPFKEALVSVPLFMLMREAGVLVACDGGWRSAVRLSSLGDQLYLHSAFPTSAGDAVFFGPDTYRFANAIEAHLSGRERPVRRAVDIGCGAGPGGIVVATARPDAAVLMLDINDSAVRLARINAALNGTPNAETRRSDLFAATDGLFDLIVSNPPYLSDAAGRAYRHGGGRMGEGLSLAILENGLQRLAPGGTLLLYTGSAIVDGIDGFRAAAERLLVGTDHARSYFEVDPDVFGEELDTALYRTADRIAAVVLTVTRKD